MTVIFINLFPDKLEICNVCSGNSLAIPQYYRLWKLLEKSLWFRKEVRNNLERPLKYIIEINNKCNNYKEFLERKRYLLEWLHY